MMGNPCKMCGRDARSGVPCVYCRYDAGSTRHDSLVKRVELSGTGIYFRERRRTYILTTDRVTVVQKGDDVIEIPIPKIVGCFLHRGRSLRRLAAILSPAFIFVLAFILAMPGLDRLWILAVIPIALAPAILVWSLWKDTYLRIRLKDDVFDDLMVKGDVPGAQEFVEAVQTQLPRPPSGPGATSPAEKKEAPVMENFREHGCLFCGKPLEGKAENDHTRRGFCDVICRRSWEKAGPS